MCALQLSPLESTVVYAWLQTEQILENESAVFFFASSVLPPLYSIDYLCALFLTLHSLYIILPNLNMHKGLFITPLLHPDA